MRCRQRLDLLWAPQSKVGRKAGPVLGGVTWSRGRPQLKLRWGDGIHLPAGGLTYGEEYLLQARSAVWMLMERAA